MSFEDINNLVSVGLASQIAGYQSSSEFHAQFPNIKVTSLVFHPCPAGQVFTIYKRQQIYAQSCYK